MNRIFGSIILLLLGLEISAQYIRPLTKTRYHCEDGVNWYKVDSTSFEYDNVLHTDQDTLGNGHYVLESPLVKLRYQGVVVDFDSFEYKDRSHLLSEKWGRFDGMKYMPKGWDQYEYYSDGRLNSISYYPWGFNRYSTPYVTTWEYDNANGDSIIIEIGRDQSGHKLDSTRTQFATSQNRVQTTSSEKYFLFKTAYYKDYLFTTWHPDSIVLFLPEPNGDTSEILIFNYSYDSLARQIKMDQYHALKGDSLLNTYSNRFTYLSNGYISSKEETFRSKKSNSPNHLTTDYFYGPYGLDHWKTQYIDSNGKVTAVGYDSIEYNTMGQPIYESLTDVYEDNTYYKFLRIYYTYHVWANGLVNILEDRNLIKIYPNPGTDIINISQLKPGDVLRIYSMDGKEMLNQKIHESAIQVSTQNWPAGLYFINGQRWVKF